MKDIIWIDTAREDLTGFPADAKQRAGYQLRRVQAGQVPNDWKPMPEVGAGVIEIRIHVEGEFRGFDVAKFEEGVYVLHAFQKKTQKTSQADIKLGKRRYNEVLKLRRR